VPYRPVKSVSESEGVGYYPCCTTDGLLDDYEGYLPVSFTHSEIL